MWQIANFMKKHGISSFNGKQVEAGEDWMQKWLGKMPEADVCLAMISGPYFESEPCKEEIYKTAREKIPILPIIFETPPPLSAPLHSPPKLVKRARRARMTTDSSDSLMELYRPPEDPPHLPRTSSGFSFDVGLQLSFDEELVSLQLS